MNASCCSARAAAVLVALTGGAGACSSSSAPCTAPSSGTFSLALTYSQTLPVSVYCPAYTTEPAVCAAAPFTGVTWTVTVDGSKASLESSDGGGSSWACSAIPPGSAAVTAADAGTPETGCYLRVICNQLTLGLIGQVQLQILAQGSGADVIAIVQDSTADCCVNEYTGTWN